MLTKAMEILEIFNQSRTEIGVVEVADLLAAPKSTVSRRLSAMESAGFLERDPSSQRYHLGIRLVTLGHLARQATPLQRVALPFLKSLTQATGETSDLVVLRGREAVNVEAVQSPRPMKHVGWAGRRLPLHATAAGKSLLAWLPEDQMRALLDLPLEGYTPNTIRSLEGLLEELEGVRARGYSTSVGEFEEDVVGVAAPVQNHLGQTMGAITIGAPLARAGNMAMPHLIRSVVEAARGMSERVGGRTVSA